METQRTSKGPEPSQRPDAGFGLTEAMVSIVILTTSLLGLAATSARIGAAMNSAHRRTSALQQAELRMETLTAQPYSQIVDGSATEDGITFQWTVTSDDDSKEIVLVYTYDVPSRARTDTLTTAVLAP